MRRFVLHCMIGFYENLSGWGEKEWNVLEIHSIFISQDKGIKRRGRAMLLPTCYSMPDSGAVYNAASSTNLSTAALSPSAFLPPAVAKWGCPPPPP